MLGAQASGAKVKPLWLAIYYDSCWMNIGLPVSVSSTLGVADIVPELGRFSTQIALQFFILP